MIRKNVAKFDFKQIDIVYFTASFCVWLPRKTTRLRDYISLFHRFNLELY